MLSPCLGYCAFNLRSEIRLRYEIEAGLFRFSPDPIDVLSSRESDFLFFFRKLHRQTTLKFDQLVDKPQGGLLLAGRDVGADSIYVDFASVLFHFQNGLFIEVVGSKNLERTVERENLLPNRLALPELDVMLTLHSP